MATSPDRTRARTTRSASEGQLLHGWHIGAAKDHPVNQQVADEMLADMGATIMGRNMFGPVRGEWGDSDWTGWRGDEPSYHCPERLFDGFEAGTPALALERVLEAPGVAHLRYRVVW